jgi:hypothetical protein
MINSWKFEILMSVKIYAAVAFNVTLNAKPVFFITI